MTEPCPVLPRNHGHNKDRKYPARDQEVAQMLKDTRTGQLSTEGQAIKGAMVTLAWEECSLRCRTAGAKAHRKGGRVGLAVLMWGRVYLPL